MTVRARVLVTTAAALLVAAGGFAAGYLTGAQVDEPFVFGAWDEAA